MKMNYEELAKAKIQEKRNIVISGIVEKGFTIAQQLEVEEENGKKTQIFLKGAFHISDLHGLYNLRDALNVAIAKTEQQPELIDNPEDNDWE